MKKGYKGEQLKKKEGGSREVIWKGGKWSEKKREGGGHS